MSDRGRDVSRALDQVRTVLSRAETARETLEVYQRRGAHIDPDHEDMLESLDRVVRELARWRRTGRAKQ